MTMTVHAIQSNDRRRSCFVPVAEGAALGTVAGYATKYILPLTPEEKSTDEYIKVRNKINSQKSEYNFRTAKVINEMKSKEKRSLAEDEFIKMFDGMKDGDHVKSANLRKAIKNLQDNPAELREFKRVCKATSEVVNSTAKQCMDAYNLVTKHIRPTGFFLVTGAVVGAVIALINDVLKTEVR
ncbi:hypothetical protein IJ472_01815 [bacterium]|nr:hypothetical protein [bacterium]